MNRNICRFVPRERQSDSISTINFVYETKPPEKNRSVSRTYYTVCLVTGGNGSLFCGQRTGTVAKGDLFFTFPETPFSLSVEAEGFTYAYISFLGVRAARILERMDINPANSVFHGFGGLEDFWMTALSRGTQKNIGILSESVLLYTLAMLSDRLECADELHAEADTLLKVKKYIDENYTSQTISVGELAEVFKYSPKYLSAALKGILNTNFKSYVTTLRIQHARMLMNQGMSNIKDIAFMSGFSDSMYFSKVFKSVTDQLPREYIAELRANKR